MHSRDAQWAEPRAKVTPGFTGRSITGSLTGGQLLAFFHHIDQVRRVFKLWGILLGNLFKDMKLSCKSLAPVEKLKAWAGLTSGHKWLYSGKTVHLDRMCALGSIITVITPSTAIRKMCHLPQIIFLLPSKHPTHWDLRSREQ